MGGLDEGVCHLIVIVLGRVLLLLHFLCERHGLLRRLDKTRRVIVWRPRSLVVGHELRQLVARAVCHCVRPRRERITCLPQHLSAGLDDLAELLLGVAGVVGHALVYPLPHHLHLLDQLRGLLQDARRLVLGQSRFPVPQQ